MRANKKYVKIKTLYLVDVHVWVHVLVCASVNGGQSQHLNLPV